MAGSLGGRREPIETRVGQPVWFNPMLEAERIGAGQRNQARLSPEFTHPLTHTRQRESISRVAGKRKISASPTRDSMTRS